MASNASFSNFIGSQAGQAALNASNSIFIGHSAGENDTVNNTSNGLSSILLGSFTNTGGYSNSIVLGSGISGSPISNTKANQFMLAPSVTEMRLRGIDYTLPSSQASTSGQVLTNNGSGGLSWETVSGGSGWSLTGNSGTSISTDFIGTTDNVDLQFRRNNQVAGQIGTYNTSYGLNSIFSNTTGLNNTAIGVNSLYSNTSGGFNVASGYNSLYSNTTGTYNVAYGGGSLYSNTTGSENTALGQNSLNSNTTGVENTASGSFSLKNNTTGYHNTANGYQSLYSNTIGNQNTALGFRTLYLNKTISRNTAIGFNSMAYANDTLSGYDAYNTALGYEALRGSTTAANNTGKYNTAIGDSALFSNTSGIENVAVGANSLYLNTTGTLNTAIGYNSLSSNISGVYNVANGGSSLSNNTTGSGNTANGVYSLYNNTTGTGNTASGYNSFASNTTGGFNTVYGYNAGSYIANGSTPNQTSSNSIYIGYDTRALSDGSNNEIVIGKSAIGNGSNTATIGSSSLLRTYLTGVNLKAGTATSGTAPLKFTAGTNLGTAETGAVEYDGTSLYFTPSGTTRKTIAYISDIPTSPITVVNSTNLFSTGLAGTGSGVTTVDYSNFLGQNAGNGATSSSFSNFFGSSAGLQATSASNSNFIGNNSGSFATSASYSNFLGTNAGYSATDAYISNFLGYQAGSDATSASNSNFLGHSAGQSATNASNSIFIGQYSGYQDMVDNTSNGLSSILIGSFTKTGGYSNSILLGSGTNSITFISNTKANQFMLSPSITEMRLRGIDYTLPSAQASTSGQVLTNDGSGALSWTTVSGGSSPITIMNSTNLFSTGLAGTGSGVTTTVSDSIFIGVDAGSSATNTSYSNFFGNSSGYQSTNASGSNFLGFSAGNSATNASNSNFFGYFAGYSASSAPYSNFLGQGSGQYATSADNSNFFGQNAGASASFADNSNFFGSYSGYQTINADNSNFFGSYSGNRATNASNSNFLGQNAGNFAINSSYSNFLGWYAGYNANNAKNSIFIGQNAGHSDIVNNTTNVDDFSILVGKDTSTGGFSNSIAIGGSATNTASNQFMIGSVTRPIDTTRWNGSSSTQCTLTTGTGIACTSDERLKTDITNLSSDTLDKLIKVKTVNFKWLEGNNTTNNIGFLAQDLENYFPELVATDSLGFKSVYYASMTPILTEAIRELDLKVKEINSQISSITMSNMIGDFYGGIVEQVVDGVKGIVVGNLKVGSPTKRTGITLYDEVTGEPYCLSIANGQTKTVSGECGIIEPKKEIEITNTKSGTGELPILATPPVESPLPEEPKIETPPVVNPTVVPIVESPVIQTPTEVPIIEEKSAVAESPIIKEVIQESVAQ
jgi:hypothetical protein